MNRGVVFFLIIMFLFSQLFATNGYFMHGVGTQHKGMAGAGVALPLSPLSVALNPAAGAMLHSGGEFGMALFSPDRKFVVTGNPSMAPGTFGLMPGEVKSGSNYFPVPSFAYNILLPDDKAAVTVAMYGHGGMNTDYDNAVFYAGKPVGVNLNQAFLSFTVSREIFVNHYFGFSYVLGYQMFEAQGIGSFAMMSSDPDHLSNKGGDRSLGYGVKFGYIGQIVPAVSVGASYQSRIWMQRFKKYQGLFAEQGDFDVPSNWTAGVAYQGNAFAVAVDYAHYNFSEIASVSNPIENLPAGGALGMGNGAGFGWDDMDVVKVGARYFGMDRWVFSAGYSFGKQPIGENQVLFNILAPAVIENHITFGVSRKLSDKKGFHLAFMYAPENSVKGPNVFEVPGQQSIELKMMQWELEVGLTF